MSDAPTPHPTADAPAVADAPAERFLARLVAALDDERFVRLVLAKPRPPAADGTRVAVRRIVLHGEPHLSFTRQHPTRDVTTNLVVADGVQEVRRLIGPGFQHAHLFTTVEEVQLLVSRKGRATLRLSPVAGTAADVVAEPARHDRLKHRWVDIERPFLVELGVTDAEHRLIPAMARKWKQIDKFVEVLDHALGEAGLKTAPRIDVADLGSGKGYLTFALHDHLRHTLELPATVTGVELRDDMVALCSAAAARLGLVDLRFERGDVRTWAPAASPTAHGAGDPPRLDVMIALHACDTATDHAIHTGIRAGARVIVCSPCCHKELRPQLLAPHPLAPILRHGVHLGQQAEMLTDGLRALLLEACGYETRVFEFVALEHTSKNKMILGVRREAPGRAADAAWAQVRELKAFYGIRDQCLERLLHESGAAA